jgi:drug/metabolite transporter (DMT)-like permease
MSASWLVPTLGYVVAVGSLGVVSKVVLRSMTWQDLVLWAAAAYAVFAALLVASGQARPNVADSLPLTLVAGALPVAGAALFFVALHHGTASQVTPVSASYPLVTMLLAATLLSERVSAVHVGGALLVVVGVILLSR